jgi:hypothetical protein
LKLGQRTDEISGQPQADDLPLSAGKPAMLGGPAGDDHAWRHPGRTEIPERRIAACCPGKAVQQVAIPVRQGREGGEAEGQHTQAAGLDAGTVQG